MTWTEDSCIKEAMLLIKNNIKDDSVHTAECTWIYEPTINYYRLEYDIPIQEVFRNDVKYEGDYLLVLNDWITNKKYQLLLMDRTSGLAVYKRKPISTN